MVASPGHDSGRTIVPQRPQPAGAVHQRGFLELRRQLAEEPDQQPDGERHRERQIRQDQSGIGVEQCSSRSSR